MDKVVVHTFKSLELTQDDFRSCGCFIIGVFTTLGYNEVMYGLYEYGSEINKLLEKYKPKDYQTVLYNTPVEGYKKFYSIWKKYEIKYSY